MKKNTLVRIIEDHGMIGEEDLNYLAAEFPMMPICIKWERSMRDSYPAKDVMNELEKQAAMDNYPREMFISADHWDKLKECFGIVTN